MRRSLSILALMVFLPMEAIACHQGDSGGDPEAGDRLTAAQRKYCVTSCACEDREDAADVTVKECEDACADVLGQNLDDAEAKSCGDEYDRYLQCLGETFVCGDDLAKVCADELNGVPGACE